MAHDANSGRHHQMWSKLCAFDQQTARVDVLLPSFRPDAVILMVHWRIKVKNFLISKEDPLCSLNSKSFEQSFGTRKSFPFNGVR